MTPANRPLLLTIGAIAVVVVIIVVALSGIGTTPNPDAVGTPSPTPTTPPPPTELKLLTHDSFAVTMPEILAVFESENNAKVTILRAGDAGAMVNQAILTKDNPLADALFGVDNTFLSRALDAGIFEPYGAAGLQSVPANLRLDPRQRVTPIDYGDVCLNYDKEAYSDVNPAPQTLEDLTRPEYRGQLVVEDPGTSSPGLAFMLATIARFGETGEYTWLDYWNDLRDNDVAIVSGWEEAYESTFSGGSGQGDRPIVVSYATSPVAEVFYSDPQPAEAPTAVITDGCFRQVEFAGVLVGAKQPQLAKKFIDYMLTNVFQSDIPLNMFVFPAAPTTDIAQVFKDYAVAVPEPLTMAPEQIGANRDRWINEWSAAAH
ncbi:MAG: thiamine ABC transporter substrate-binding protein [Candidatus Limnocylindrales bacterium]